MQVTAKSVMMVFVPVPPGFGTRLSATQVHPLPAQHTEGSSALDWAMPPNRPARWIVETQVTH